MNLILSDNQGICYDHDQWFLFTHDTLGVQTLTGISADRAEQEKTLLAKRPLQPQAELLAHLRLALNSAEYPTLLASGRAHLLGGPTSNNISDFSHEVLTEKEICARLSSQKGYFLSFF